jgi:hypothetical protein
MKTNQNILEMLFGLLLLLHARRHGRHRPVDGVQFRQLYNVVVVIVVVRGKKQIGYRIMANIGEWVSTKLSHLKVRPGMLSLFTMINC